MTPPESPPPRRPFPWAAAAAGAALLVLLGLYPPIRVVRAGRAPAPGTPGQPAPAAITFAAPAFAEEFWTTQLQPAALRVPDLAPILADLRRDPAAAAGSHGRRVGLGHTAYVFARATGRVVAVEGSRVLVDVAGGTVALRTGPVFGNTLRDGCGLLDVNRAPGLAEFNAVAAELNRLVEQRVQPALRAATVGATVDFAGAAELPEAIPAGGPLLTVIPVRAALKP